MAARPPLHPAPSRVVVGVENGAQTHNGTFGPTRQPATGNECIMLKKRRGLARLASVVVVASLVMLGTAVEASGATDMTFFVSPGVGLPGQTLGFEGQGWESCGTVSVFLDTTASGSATTGSTIATFPAGSTTISGKFTAPSTPRTYTLNAHSTSAPPGCNLTASFIVAVPATLSLSPTAATPGQIIHFTGAMHSGCIPFVAHLGTTLIPTSLSGHLDTLFSAGFLGSFTAPSTLGAHTLTVTSDHLDSTNAALCEVSAQFDVVAATTSPEVSGEPESGPGEPGAATAKSQSAPSAPEAATAPVSATPLHVTG